MFPSAGPPASKFGRRKSRCSCHETPKFIKETKEERRLQYLAELEVQKLRQKELEDKLSPSIAVGEDDDDNSVEEISGGFEDSVIGGEDLDEDVYVGPKDGDSKDLPSPQKPVLTQKPDGTQKPKEPQTPDAKEGPEEILRYAILRR